MANKTVVFTEPLATDVKRITIVCDDLGSLLRVTGHLEIATDDSTDTTHQGGGIDLDIAKLPKAAADAVGAIVAQTLAEYKAANGF